MTNHRIRLALVALAAAGAASIALATVPGGGPAKSDCYLEFGGVTATKGATTVECTDGTACDQDGVCNNSCDFGVQVCLNQSDVVGCTAPAGGLSSVALKANGSSVTLQGLGLTSSACGAFPGGTVVALKQNKKKTKYLNTKFKLSGTSKAQPGVKPNADKDKATLICVPSPTPCNGGSTTTTTTRPPSVGPECLTANPQGGPDQLNLFVTTSSDLDNGWTGVSHNFPVPVGTTVRFCLSNCDTTTDPICDGVGSTDVGGTNPPSLNGPTFGPPLPLVAGGIPVCVVNKYADPTITGTVNIQTGEINGSIHLSSEIWTTPAGSVCPKCSGATFGATGTCGSGAKKNQPCVTEGIVAVNSDNPPISGVQYTLSSSCPPGGLGQQKVATLSINLDPLTTGATTTTASGPKPCPGAASPQTQDDGCGGSACTASCPSAPPLKGGINQYCCNNGNQQPCFPTKTGMIMRTGQLEVPTPAWPDTTYPKTGVGGTSGENLSSVFCIDKTNSNIDGVTGLPGPGSLILPVKQCYKKLGDACP